LYLPRSCSAFAHTLQSRWTVASVQVPRRWRCASKRRLDRLLEDTRMFLSTWFISAFLQECVHAVRAIKLSSPIKRAFLQAVDRPRACASEHSCMQHCVSVLMLLLKLVSVQTSVQEYESSIISLYPLDPQ
jgi:hypothetical protein